MSKSKYKTALNPHMEQIFAETMMHEKSQCGGLTAHGVSRLRKALATISKKRPEIHTHKQLYAAARAWLLTEPGIRNDTEPEKLASLWFYDGLLTVYERFAEAGAPEVK